MLVRWLSLSAVRGNELGWAKGNRADPHNSPNLRYTPPVGKLREAALLCLALAVSSCSSTSSHYVTDASETGGSGGDSGTGEGGSAGSSGSTTNTGDTTVTSTSGGGTTVTNTSGSDSGGSSDSGGTGGTTSTPSATSASEATTGGTTTETLTSTSGDGSGGGSSDAGGTGGSGTGGSVATTSTPSTMVLIDDLEDGNDQLETPAYSGYWFTAVDPSGNWNIVPDPADDCDPTELDTPRGDSNRAMHVSGNWSNGEWASLGFWFDQDEAAIDGSAYAGIHFFARTSVANPVRILLMIDGVTDSGYHALDLDLDAAWSEVMLLWDEPDLAQPSWAAEVPFDPSELLGVQFQFVEGEIDLWVDDIRFIE